MAITPIVAFSAEWGTMDEWPVPPTGVGPVVVYSTDKKTGNYCFRLNDFINGYAGYPISATRQLRFGVHNRPGAQLVATVSAQVYSVMSGGTELLSVRMAANADEVNFVNLSGTVVADSDPVIYGTWQHWGVDLKVHPSAGWLRLWVDGVLTLTFDGNTGNADIDQFRLGSFGTNRAFLDTVGLEYLVDDLYIDDTTGETTPALPPDRRFLLGLPNADTVPNDWTPSTGTSHFALIDDVPLVTTTYLSSAVLAQEDVFTITAPTLPDGYVTQALWLQALANKSNGAVDTKVALRTQTTVGSDQALGTALAMKVQRFAETNLTHEFGVKSAGTF